MISSPDEIDLDTLPAAKNAREVSKGIKALALDELVKKIVTISLW